MVNSNEKGGENERETCKMFSLWVSGGHNSDYFWRSAMSGGRSTLASKHGRARLKSTCGDIVATHEDGNAFLDVFMIECKHLLSLKLGPAIYQCKGEMEQLWDKPLIEAIDHGKQPIVVAKGDRKRHIVFVSKEGYRLLSMTCPDLELMNIMRRRIDIPTYEKAAKKKVPDGVPVESWVYMLKLTWLFSQVKFAPLLEAWRKAGHVRASRVREQF